MYFVLPFALSCTGNRNIEGIPPGLGSSLLVRGLFNFFEHLAMAVEKPLDSSCVVNMVKVLTLFDMM